MPANPDCVLTVSLLLILIVFLVRRRANAILPSLEINSIMFIRFLPESRRKRSKFKREKTFLVPSFLYKCLSYLRVLDIF